MRSAYKCPECAKQMQVVIANNQDGARFTGWVCPKCHREVHTVECSVCHHEDMPLATPKGYVCRMCGHTIATYKK